MKAFSPSGQNVLINNLSLMGERFLPGQQFVPQITPVALPVVRIPKEIRTQFSRIPHQLILMLYDHASRVVIYVPQSKIASGIQHHRQSVDTIFIDLLLFLPLRRIMIKNDHTALKEIPVVPA